MIEFELKEEHIKLLSKSNINWDFNSDLGAACIDPKRPYGNSGIDNIIHDIATILDIKPSFTKYDEIYYSEEQDKHLLELHCELKDALQIILCCKTFETGIYIKQSEYDSFSWRKK